MHILARLLPNNKLQIRRYRIADGYGRAANKGDTPIVREGAYTAKQLQEAERITRLISSASEDQTIRYKLPNAAPSVDSSGKLRGDLEWNYGASSACSLPMSISFPSPSDGGKDIQIEQVNYTEACNRRLLALDLLKKSQHNSKKPRPWGSQTKLKEFRYQAGEKIKEGGAIIDRFIGVENSTMITLTLPGDNWAAFDALARWSGWVVNRLCQVIRRRPKNTPEPYWFFVWEHQKRGALHMHWCLGWEVDQPIREDLAYRLKDLWFTLLEEISVKESIDLFAQKGFKRTHRGNPGVWKWDVQQVKSSVAAYFAKYCAKNTRLSQPEPDTGAGGTGNPSTAPRKRTVDTSRTCPSRYWGSSGTIKRWSRRLRVEHKFTVDSPEFANTVLCRIRQLLPGGQCYKSITKVPFEIFEPSTGICIASGETETYVLEPNLYPDFHRHVCEHIMERPYRMDAMDLEFLATGDSKPVAKTRATIGV